MNTELEVSYEAFANLLKNHVCTFSTFHVSVLNCAQGVWNLCPETWLAQNKKSHTPGSRPSGSAPLLQRSNILRNGTKISRPEIWAFSFLLFDARRGAGEGISHKVLHIKRGAVLSSAALVLVSCIKHREFLFTFTYEGWKILATYPGLYKRGLFSPSEGTVSNITRQLARKREMEEPITSAS